MPLVRTVHHRRPGRRGRLVAAGGEPTIVGAPRSGRDLSSAPADVEGALGIGAG
ncbi:MAG TPA: hypothetical protein VLB47_06715 [Solirubrobacteraceae bacterium]|nr:hypothetical protein [Solirubrobacteraceae bacterium]